MIEVAGTNEGLRMSMNRLLIFELACLSLVIAWFLYTVAYILSAPHGVVTMPDVEPDRLVKVTKVLYWAAAGALVTTIFTTAGLFGAKHIAALSAVSVGALVLLVAAAVIWMSLYLFAVV